MTEKKKLRAEIKAMRRSMDPERKKALDDRIFRRLAGWEVLLSAERVLVYMSAEIEVSTVKIIEFCREKGIKTALPRCFGAGEMKFYYYDSNTRLEISDYGIPEPAEDSAEVRDFDNTLCIVPALAFDSRGYRLGYGGGYYDRFLAEHGEVIPAVICYGENRRENLLHNDYDRKAAYVVTENGLEVCAK